MTTKTWRCQFLSTDEITGDITLNAMGFSAANQARHQIMISWKKISTSMLIKSIHDEHDSVELPWWTMNYLIVVWKCDEA